MTILKFSAPWCGPCNAIKPYFHTLKEEYPGVTFQEYNISETEDHLKYGVMSIPTVILVNKDEEVSRLTGAKTLEDYKKLFEKAIDTMS